MICINTYVVSYRSELERELQAHFDNTGITVLGLTDRVFPEDRYFIVHQKGFTGRTFAEIHPLKRILAYWGGDDTYRTTDLDLDILVDIFEKKGYDCIDTEGYVLGCLGDKPYITEVLERRKEADNSF